ncbi:molybdopterin molybdotransferase MoeA [Paracoccus bogoriensis]|uniref:molybdopterin molybdotransferase MoeA n=1 Tax=Paracoccus bogoriensis TaxID=242065 RepID=UPI001CA5B35D|nr:gephyrin-like molybdotransferase Glp [Paracoccus bogoriensis]MBW7057611.1 molybdopterin molybdotransferase MoeA [Paracoccus bogoriensis]
MTPEPVLDRPDPLRCGCDAAATEGLLPVDVALVRALALARPVAGIETLTLAAAAGRITAAPVTSPLPLPPFDNAAMDGYGLDPAALAGPGPWVLPLAGRARAGDAPGRCPPGSALRILTGAAIPEGVKAVVPQEEVQRQDGRIVLRQRPAPGAHIRRAGSDLTAGAVVLAAGRAIGPREAGALAAAGQGRVAVRRRVRVAILSTGSELVEPGQPLAPGQIWNANRAQLAAALALPFVELIDLGPVPDVPERIAAALGRAAEEADLIVTTGGVSVGDEDHTTRLVRAAGGAVHAMRLAMKPGKPLTLGTLAGAVWLGLPGNPVAAFVAWTVLGAPVLRAMAGMADPGPRKLIARLAAGVTHRAGRCEYRPARHLGHDARGVAAVRCLSGPGSHRAAQLAQADGLALIPADAEALPEGALVEFLPF